MSNTKTQTKSNPKSPSRPAQPELPHERDERTGSTDGAPSERVKQAHRDVSRGVQDTSRAPEADRAYQRQKSKR
jgi:hypothetical protein